jgi:DNA-binding IclR family transcriptional regulator
VTPVENKSLVKSLSVLETLAASPAPLSAAQLSHRLKLTRPTVYRILGTLSRHEYVTRDADGPTYRVSFKLLDLGHQILERTDLLGAARPALRDLSAQFHETVHLAVEEEGRIVYLDKVEGSGPFCTNSRTGRRVPMHCTALGKAVLAYLPADKVRAIVARHGLLQRTPRTIVTMAGLEQELMRVRRQGYATDDIEFEEGVRCVGAPILDHRGLPVAAISVSAPVSRMPRARAHTVGRILRDAVTGVSRAMGWRPAAGSPPPRIASRRGGGLGRRAERVTAGIRVG